MRIPCGHDAADDGLQLLTAGTVAGLNGETLHNGGIVARQDRQLEGSEVALYAAHSTS
jgi:hypothetical protein